MKAGRPHATRCGRWGRGARRSISTSTSTSSRNPWCSEPVGTTARAGRDVPAHCAWRRSKAGEWAMSSTKPEPATAGRCCCRRPPAPWPLSLAPGWPAPQQHRWHYSVPDRRFDMRVRDFSDTDLEDVYQLLMTSEVGPPHRKCRCLEAADSRLAPDGGRGSARPSCGLRPRHHGWHVERLLVDGGVRGTLASARRRARPCRTHCWRGAPDYLGTARIQTRCTGLLCKTEDSSRLQTKWDRADIEDLYAPMLEI